MNSANTSLGFIGLGVMGRPMVRSTGMSWVSQTHLRQRVISAASTIRSSSRSCYERVAKTEITAGGAGA